jgi:MSHA biogenesis protein MshP
MNMRPKFHYRAQSGFAAIAAIFLVVGLAALGAFMVTFSNTQQLTSAQDVQGTRAYWAARAGLEVAIVSAVTRATSDTTGACSDASRLVAVPASITVTPFTVFITCTPASYTDGVGINIFQLQSTASVGGVGGIGYIERSVSASVCRLQAAPYTVC